VRALRSSADERGTPSINVRSFGFDGIKRRRDYRSGRLREVVKPRAFYRKAPAHFSRRGCFSSALLVRQEAGFMRCGGENQNTFRETIYLRGI